MLAQIKTAKNVILLSVFLLLGGSTFVLYKLYEHEKAERKIETENNRQLLQDEASKILELQKSEIEKYYSKEIKMLNDSLDEKTKHLKQMTVVKNFYISNDTTMYITKQLPSDSNKYDISQNQDSCWGFNGYFDIQTKTATITQKMSYNEFVEYIIEKRKRLFGWKWTPRIGKLQEDRYILDKCGSDIKMTTIRTRE